MKLFAHPESGHAFKVRFFLKAAKIDHDYEVVDIFQPCDARPAEFRKHARYHEVPVLVDDGQAYVQSNAILMHLAKKTGEWGAESPAQFTLCLEWLFWEANKIGMCLPQLRASEKFSATKLDDGTRQWLLGRYTHDVCVLDREFSDGRPFITGQTLTIADFSLCGYLYFADQARVTVPDNVAAWLERLSQVPGWAHPYELMAG